MDACDMIAGMWPEPYPTNFSKDLDQMSQPFQDLARHYGLTHINLHHLMSKGILGLPGR